MRDMAEPESTPRFVFPAWANYLLPVLVVLALGGGAYVPVVVGLGGSPETTDIGYAPTQPVPFSHALHVGQLGMDCRYCHTTVDSAAFAAIPPTQTCMNCHAQIKADSVNLVAVRESWAEGTPIDWVKVHDLPDYVYFNHSAHINKGVGCNTCHGQINEMEVVYQARTLSMSWCLDCHREPEKYLRPLDEVTNMRWQPPQEPGESLAAAQLRLGQQLKREYGIHDQLYMTSCSTCHR